MEYCTIRAALRCLHAGMPEAPVAPLCFPQLPHLLQAGLTYRRKNKLGDSITASNSIRIPTKINQTDFHLAPVIGIYCPRRIDDGDSVLYRQAGSGPDLYLEAIGQSNGESGGQDFDVAGVQGDIFRDGGRRIHTGRLSGRVSRQAEIPAIVGILPAEMHICQLHI